MLTVCWTHVCNGIWGTTRVCVGSFSLHCFYSCSFPYLASLVTTWGYYSTVLLYITTCGTTGVLPTHCHKQDDYLDDFYFSIFLFFYKEIHKCICLYTKEGLKQTPDEDLKQTKNDHQEQVPVLTVKKIIEIETGLRK